MLKLNRNDEAPMNKSLDLHIFLEDLEDIQGVFSVMQQCGLDLVPLMKLCIPIGHGTPAYFARDFESSAAYIAAPIACRRKECILCGHG